MKAAPTRVCFGAFLLLALLAAISPAAWATTVRSDFDADQEDWTFEWYSSLTHVSTPLGTNPGGYLKIREQDGSAAHLLKAVAPSAFLGDWTAINGGSLSFEATLIVPKHVDRSEFGQVSLTNGGGETLTYDVAYFNSRDDNANPNKDVWSSYSASLDATTWGKTESEWSAFITNITALTLTIDVRTDSGFWETTGLDTVVLSSEPAVVPEPTGLLLVLLGCGLTAGRCRGPRARRS